MTPDGKTAYVIGGTTVTPIATATSTPGKPIQVRSVQDLSVRGANAITPDGKTLYVANVDAGTVTPITTATNTADKPIRVGRGAGEIAITPDGKTAYVVSGVDYPGWGTVTPITTATNTPVGRSGSAGIRSRSRSPGMGRRPTSSAVPRAR
jgi:YVTN family beta-propeller protein